MQSNGRGILVGQTGTGKSTLAAELIAKKRNLLIIDPKHQFYPSQKYELVTNPDELANTANKAFVETEGKLAILYRPPIETLEDLSEINRVFLFAFLRQNTFVYVDEGTSVTKSPMTYPFYLKAIYTQGRGRNVGILTATQRPVGLPGFIFSESGRLWKFYLSLLSDQERMAEYMGNVVVEPKDKRVSAHDRTDNGEISHTFYFKDINLVGEAKQYELVIDTGAVRKGDE